MTSDDEDRCIWTGQESKAGRVRLPATGYIAISPGPEMRAVMDALVITPLVEGGSSEEFAREE